MDYLIWILIAYLIGSIPIGYWIGKLKSIDLTKEGSGSTGTTNVLRKVGKVPALITLVFDVLKGFFPVYFVIHLQNSLILVLFVGIACILGHSKSIFLKFKGGKSSATGLGILIAISWKVALITFLIWLIVVLASRYSSLGSIIAIPLVPVWFYLFHMSYVYVLFGIFAAVYIVLIKHRENIQRLLAGTEPKIGENRLNNFLFIIYISKCFFTS
ncbi:MAG: glycerol-3-phosphate 1-O-acyltransferase PlsY [Candidatus Melainabacteria bacterium]|nr:glycerol-3-phosphate 1-O-acyltransferase PlsY [Candidatus Melainabacteria bacterium]